MAATNIPGGGVPDRRKSTKEYFRKVEADLKSQSKKGGLGSGAKRLEQANRRTRNTRPFREPI